MGRNESRSWPDPCSQGSLGSSSPWHAPPHLQQPVDTSKTPVTPRRRSDRLPATTQVCCSGSDLPEPDYLLQRSCHSPRPTHWLKRSARPETLTMPPAPTGSSTVPSWFLSESLPRSSRSPTFRCCR